MHARSFVLIATLVCGCWLAACSKDTAAAAVPDASGPTGDPCALVPDNAVRSAFAGANTGKRDNSTDKYGIATCTWDTPTNAFVAQIFKAAGPVEAELKSRASGVIDPVKLGAGKNFRYEKLAGVGEDTMLVAERGDPANGVFNDVAVLVTRHGDRMAVLFVHSLIDDDREATVKALTELGRKAAARL